MKFEKSSHVWKCGDRKEVARMRIQKKHPNGVIENLRIEKLVPTNPDEVFIKARYGFDVAHKHLVELIGHGFKEVYLIRQDFIVPSEGDPLGGFNSGKTWEITNHAKLMLVLEDLQKKGWRQVPYIRGAKNADKAKVKKK